MESKPFSWILLSLLILSFFVSQTHEKMQGSQTLVYLHNSTLKKSFGFDTSFFDAIDNFNETSVHSQEGLKEKDRIERLPGQTQVNFSQYGGYVTVDKSAGRALYYDFAEAQHSKDSLPLLLWLNGGPGCSSLAYGAMQELGPFRVHSDGKTLNKNKFSWNYAANVLFLEFPAGVGFSYSNTTKDYSTSGDRRAAGDNNVFLLNWLKRFPEYMKRDFYVVGESYAGHYVPQLARTILFHNKKANKTIINLKGIILCLSLSLSKPLLVSFSFSKPLPHSHSPQSKMKMNLLLLFLADMVVRATSQPPNTIPIPYDYYSVVFQWVKSVCNSGMYQCTKPTFPAFTLHGLWPQRYNFPPLDCRRLNFGYTQFNNNLIPVNDRNILIRYWPNMYGQNEAFWGHEYEKHGSCVDPFYYDQLAYFVTAHRVAASINLYSILLAAGIRFGNPTTVGAVQTAIHASTGFWPTVQCNRSITRTLQLFQIYLCFDKATNVLMDCPMVQIGCIDPIDYPRP